MLITTKNDNFKLDDSNLVCEPATTVEAIKEKYTDKTITVKKTDGTTVTTGNIGTGYTITIGDEQYKIIKKGDTNGDGEVKATDYMKIKNSIMVISNLTDEQKEAADVNGDGEVKATDYMKIKNMIMGVSGITI